MEVQQGQEDVPFCSLLCHRDLEQCPESKMLNQRGLTADWIEEEIAFQDKIQATGKMKKWLVQRKEF